MSEKDYITIGEGIFQGVSYRIRDAEFVEEGGNHFVKMDYDVRNLMEKDSQKFEDFLGQFLIDAMEDAVKTDEEKK